MEFAAKECLKCSLGWSQPGSSRCSLCSANYYIDTNSTNRDCVHCPNDTYSFPGSIGIDSCIEMSACTNTDILTNYG
jgi:hypothetical protein